MADERTQQKLQECGCTPDVIAAFKKQGIDHEALLFLDRKSLEKNFPAMCLGSRLKLTGYIEQEAKLTGDLERVTSEMDNVRNSGD